MARHIVPTVTPRHRLPYADIPTHHGRLACGGIERYTRDTYGGILDCVYEMANMVSTSNGIPVSVAIDQVLRDEHWHILPTHRKLIFSQLTA